MKHEARHFINRVKRDPRSTLGQILYSIFDVKLLIYCQTATGRWPLALLNNNAFPSFLILSPFVRHACARQNEEPRGDGRGIDFQVNLFEWNYDD